MIPSKKTIHVITNDVTKQFVADTITAVGASPIMSETAEEFADIYSKINAAVINLGMVNPQKKEVILIACSEAKKNKVPMVIDLVGIHFSAYRRDFALYLLKYYDFAIIKGNYDEISALVSVNHSNSFDASQPLEIKRIQLASKIYPNSILVATGATDYLCHNDCVQLLTGGSTLLPRISGTGCVLSGLLGVLLAQNAPQIVEIKTLSRLCKVYKEASERAEITSQKRIGQFKTDLISEISEIEVLL